MMAKSYKFAFVINRAEDIFDLVVIGGGAAGFFGAIQAAEMKPGLRIVILERSNKLLSKVLVSGGGRCNVTHSCFSAAELSKHYPRGEKPLKQMFKTFNADHTIRWFESKGVSLKVEEDGRMFPDTDSSQTIVDCFMREVFKHQIKIMLSIKVVTIIKTSDCFQITSDQGSFTSRKILVAIGGNPDIRFYDFIKNLGHSIIPPIPSLFTFNDNDKKFKDLMGVAVPDGEVRIIGTKFLQTGPVLITHWGLSGPAVIKLSAWAAEYLHQQGYEFEVSVSWIGSMKEEALRTKLQDHKQLHGKQKVRTNPLFGLPQRLWERLCDLSEIESAKIWNELPNKSINKLIEYLIRCPFKIKGKTTFKEEFVTCGGVDLKEVNTEVMESKLVPQLFFAGEALHIDGETGGFNFQAAWTTAHLAACGITKA